MSVVCLRNGVSGWAEGAAEALLEVAPRVAVEEGGVVWLDARGRVAEAVAAAALARVGRGGVGCGVWRERGPGGGVGGGGAGG